MSAESVVVWCSSFAHHRNSSGYEQAGETVRMKDCISSQLTTTSYTASCCLHALPLIERHRRDCLSVKAYSF